MALTATEANSKVTTMNETNELAPVTRPKAINRTGGGTEGSEVKYEPQGASMHDNLRKGVFGFKVAAKGPTSQPNDEEFIPTAGDQSAEKYGLGKGPQGAI